MLDTIKRLQMVVMHAGAHLWRGRNEGGQVVGQAAAGRGAAHSPGGMPMLPRRGAAGGLLLLLRWSRLHVQATLIG